MVNFIKFTPEVSRDWKSVQSAVRKTKYKHCSRRVEDASTSSQLQSKLWLIGEISNLGLDGTRVGILAGWYANFIVPLLVDELETSMIYNFEIDEDVKQLSYKFNKRYKDDKTYKCEIVDVMFSPIWKKMKGSETGFDLVINTSCEHMFPMYKFRDLNRGFLDNPIYVLQSTDDDQYDDHINCVSSPDELAEQAKFVDVLYSGTKVLDNGMNRFMVIGK
jgi:hypothetical protein